MKYSVTSMIAHLRTPSLHTFVMRLIEHIPLPRTSVFVDVCSLTVPAGINVKLQLSYNNKRRGCSNN